VGKGEQQGSLDTNESGLRYVYVPLGFNTISEEVVLDVLDLRSSPIIFNIKI
jgi:hypothetical protein